MELDSIFYLGSIFLLLGVYLASGLYMFLKYYSAQKSEVKSSENRLFLLYGLFFTFLMIGRFCLFIFDFYLTHFDISNISDTEFLIWKIGLTFKIFGYSCLLILMEYRTLKQRDYYALAIFYFIFYILGMISNNIEDAGVYTFIATAFSIFIPIAYLYIAIKSQQKIRRKALLIFFGFMIFFIAMSLDVEPVLLTLMDVLNFTRIQVYVLINIVKTVAIVFFFFGFK